MKKLYALALITALYSIYATAQERQFPKKQYIQILQEAYEKTGEKDHMNRGSNLWKCLESCPKRHANPRFNNSCAQGVMELKRFEKELPEMCPQLLEIRQDVLN